MKSVNNVHELFILEAFPEDEGEYKCVVTNPAGSTSSAAVLKIERKLNEFILNEFKAKILY
jgi:hypothetical protein